MSRMHITSVEPARAIPGGRVALHGDGLSTPDAVSPEVRVQGHPARVVFASPSRVAFLVPGDLAIPGAASISVGNSGDIATLDVATAVATGLHQVDNPVFDRHGNLYVTYSGTRGQQVPVSIFRVTPSGTRESYSSGIVNPTSMAFDRDGRLHVSSRFEGIVYRVADDGSSTAFATELGIACGLVFGEDGTLFVGDRSGTIFAVDSRGQVRPFATLPSSVAAFHLARGADGLYVTGPTLSTNDAVYHVSYEGAVSVIASGFGRPQGLAVSDDGTLHVVEALAGNSGLYRVDRDGSRTLVLAGSGLVGVAFDRRGGLVVCSNDTAYRLPRFA